MSQGEGRSMQLIVVTPERKVLDEPVDFVAFPALDGEMGVLAGRAPLVARLGPGELRFSQAKGTPRRYFVDGGFVQVRTNVVTILTPRARAADDLVADQIVAQLDQTNALVPNTEQGLDEKGARLANLRAQLRMLKKS